ncbi:thiamine pyrophosphate-dependent enzyme [Serratia ureilytica]
MKKLATPSDAPHRPGLSVATDQRFIRADDGGGGKRHLGRRHWRHAHAGRRQVVNQPIWGSIGTPAGAARHPMATPQRRHLLFIGDGSFQLTAQEVSTLLRCEQKPIIFLINNDGYTIGALYPRQLVLQRHRPVGLRQTTGGIEYQAQPFSVAVETTQQLEMARNTPRGRIGWRLSR